MKIRGSKNIKTHNYLSFFHLIFTVFFIFPVLSPICAETPSNIDISINCEVMAPLSLFLDNQVKETWEIKENIIRIISFPFIHIAIRVDKILKFIEKQTYSEGNRFSLFFRKIAFKNSIQIITSKSGEEIKFMDKSSSDPNDYLGWAKLNENGSLDMQYKVKKFIKRGKYLYLTHFSGNDILDYIFNFFAKETNKINRIECLFDKSNLNAFNIAYAEKPADKIRAIKKTHFGHYIMDKKKWTVLEEEISPVGNAGHMRSAFMQAGRSNFENVEVDFYPPKRFQFNFITNNYRRSVRLASLILFETSS